MVGEDTTLNADTVLQDKPNLVQDSNKAYTVKITNYCEYTSQSRTTIVSTPRSHAQLLWVHLAVLHNYCDYT